MEFLDALYDDSAEKYDSLLVAQRFRNPAIDLIQAMDPAPGSCLLDVGTGTGAALFPALDRIGHRGTVVGLDPSREMLQVAQRKGATLLVEGKIPGSKFLENTFDSIAANFVLSHMADYRAGLREIYQLLKPGGTFGTTTWGEGQQHYNAIWNEIAGQFIHPAPLKEIGSDQIPWETWFEQPDHLQETLTETGFTGIVIRRKEYALSMSLSDYLDCRYTLLSGKFIQRMLSPSLFQEFQSRMYEAYWKVSGETIEYVGRVNIVVAKK